MSRETLSLVFLVVLLRAGLAQTSLTLNVTQDVYQAEEHGTITLTWMYPVQTDSPPDPLVIDVMRVDPLRRIFHYDSWKGEELYPHEDSRGRLRCDTQLARRGQVHCVLTQLWLNDSGTYQCVVVVDQHVGYRSCDLSVTAAASHVAEEEKPEEKPDPESRGRSGLCAGSAFFVVTCAGLGLWCFFRNRFTSNS